MRQLIHNHSAVDRDRVTVMTRIYFWVMIKIENDRVTFFGSWPKNVTRSFWELDHDLKKVTRSFSIWIMTHKEWPDHFRFGSWPIKSDPIIFRFGSWPKKCDPIIFDLDNDPKINPGHDRDPITIHSTMIMYQLAH